MNAFALVGKEGRNQRLFLFIISFPVKTQGGNLDPGIGETAKCIHWVGPFQDLL